MSRGYKDLFDTIDYKSEYRKPTRKDSLYSKKSVLNGFENPIKEAIANRKVPKSYLQYIRKPQKIPPSYLAKLRNLDDQARELDKHHVLMETRQKWEQEHLLSLKFNDQVEAERCPISFFKNHNDSVWKPPDIIQNGKKSNKKSLELVSDSSKKSEQVVDHGLHKSSWLRDVERPETIRRLSMSVETNALMMEGFKMGLKSLKEDQSLIKKETYSTRNVQYMLDIWQKSEGVDLDSFLKSEERVNYQKSISANQRAKELAYDKTLKLTDNSLFVQAFDANIEKSKHPQELKIKSHKELVIDKTAEQLTSLNEELSNISRRKITFAKSKSGFAKVTDQETDQEIVKLESVSPRSINTPSSKQSGSKLSKSTLKVLKKLSLESNEDIQAQTSSDQNNFVKLTLTGPQEVVMQSYFLSDGNRSFVPIRVKRRHEQMAYSPGAWSKVIKSYFLPNGEIRICDSSNTENEPQSKQFQLVLTDVNSLAEDDDESIDLGINQSQSSLADFDDIDDIIPEENEDQHYLEENSQRPTVTQRRLSTFQRRLSIFNQKNSSGEKKIHTLEELNKMAHDKKEQERATSVKRYLNCNFENDEEPFGLPQLPPGSPILNRLSDFISSPYCELEYITETDPIARICLLRALTLALRETQQKELCFEAAEIIIKSGISSELGRWDALLLKDVLSQMLSEGSQLYKDTACIVFCEKNQVNTDVVQHLRTGFGDNDDKRRQLLNSLFSKLEIRFISTVLDILVEDASNVNYRVRIDIIYQISNYVERLSGTVERPKVIQHKNLNDQNIESTDSTEAENLIFNGIEILLHFMWEDWSEQVRDLASQTLGKLHQGNAIYNHLIYLISSENPAKRLDALKCLGHLGLITISTLSDFIDCFKDPFTAIRQQACKVACKLKSDNRDIIQALLNCLDDADWQIRAFAIKAIGFSGTQAPKTKTSLKWFMMHDENPIVRAEAIVAFQNLGYVESDSVVRDWLITLLQTDTSDAVKKEAEKVLVEVGILLPATNTTEDTVGGFINSLASRLPANLALPFPSILQGKTKEEVEIFLRDSLIEDKEQSDVISQVRLLAKKEKVLQQVQHEERHSGILPKLQLDLNLDQDHIPDLKAIHLQRKIANAHA